MGKNKENGLANKVNLEINLKLVAFGSVHDNKPLVILSKNGLLVSRPGSAYLGGPFRRYQRGHSTHCKNAMGAAREQ